MRRVTSVLLFCLLASTMAVTMKTSVIQNMCLTKNKFVEAMSVGYPINVTIFKMPLMPGDKPFAKCASEWNQFGTCCNVVQLEALHGFEHGTMEHNKFWLQTAVSQLVNLITQQVNVSSSFKTKILTAVDGFNNSNNKCWGHISTMRGTAMCPTCSGRSEVFFNAAKDKLLIDTDTCRETVELCEPIFKTLAWVGNNTATIKQEFKRVTDKTTNQYLNLLLNDIKKYSPPASLSTAFAVYDLHRDDAIRSGVYSAKLCAMIVNVRKQPFPLVEDANSRFRVRRYQIKAKYDDITDLEVKFDESVAGKTLTAEETSAARAKFFGATAYARYLDMQAEYKVSKDINEKEKKAESDLRTLSLKTAESRGLTELLLASPPNFDDFFNSDCSVLLNPADVNAFSKHDLVDCCTVQSSMSSYRAMNMSLAFP